MSSVMVEFIQIITNSSQVAKELEGAREQADADTKMVLRQVEKDSDELVALLKKEREREQSCYKLPSDL